ncbi:putative reverse transcriptase domain-containing protein [Tanacetum coccineum]
MDPYEEVAQQGQVPPLSPAFVPDLMELDEHVPAYVLKPEHPEYHAPSDDDIQVKDQPYADDASPTVESPGYIADSDLIEDDIDEGSIDYPYEPKDGEEDDDEDPEEDPNEEHEPEDEDTKDEEPSKGSDETKPFEEDKTAVIPPPPPRLRGARISVRPQTPMAASTQTLINAFAAGSPLFLLPPTSPAYDQAPLGHRAAMIRIRDDIPKEDIPPRSRFVLTAPPPRCHVAKSSTASARAPRAANRAEDVGYVRALQAFEHRMMTSIEEVNLRVSYQAQVLRQESVYFYTHLRNAWTDHRDIRLEIDVVRGQRTASETKLHERHRAEDDAVRQMMRIHVLEARAQIDIVEDTDSRTNDTMTPESIQAMINWASQRNSTYTQDDASQNLVGGTKGVFSLSQWIKKMESVFHISGCAVDNQVKFATCTLLGAALTWWNSHVRTLGHDAAYAMTWGTLKKKFTDKYCLKGEIKKLEIELWNLRVKGNDVAAYTQHFQELALMCTKFLADETEKVDKYNSGLPDNIHGNVMSARPKTLDDAIELAKDLMDQKLCTYAERQNDNKRKAGDSSRNNQQPHKKKNVARAYTADPGEKMGYTGTLPLCTKCNYHHTGQCAPKCGNCKRTVELGNGNGIAQGRAYAFGEEEMPAQTVTSSRGNLANGKIIGVNTIIRGCTLNFMNIHPFNIDLMPVPLGSFDVIIGMDWLTKYHGVIICDEKIDVMDVFLAYITTKEDKDKSEGKRLEDVPIVRDFPEVFPEDLLGISPSRQVEFQIDLVPGDAPIALAPYRLAPSKMKELAEQLL